MTDIVERLRFLNTPALLPSLQRVTTDAACEIERLRESLGEMREACAACFRVINSSADHEALALLLEEELRQAGIAGGFGKRAAATLAKEGQ